VVLDNFACVDAVVGLRGDIARVSRVTETPHRIYLEYPNGNQATVDATEPIPWPVGTVLLVNADQNFLEPAPDDLWPEELWVGVVKLRHEDVTVVETSGRLRRLETNDVEYHVGNTVEGNDSAGVVRVLDDRPISYLEMPRLDDAVIEQFKITAAGGETFADFGGLPHVVARAKELIELPLQHREALAAIGAKPVKGVLFTGEPGTGKTMLARIIANEAGATFYEISGPQIFSKWYGESEEILRKTFDDAAEQERSIVFFDEIDSVAGQRDEHAHEASRRVVAQLLTLDGRIQS
jgi:transitional endoplasmic reticulum ATPase